MVKYGRDYIVMRVNVGLNNVFALFHLEFYLMKHSYTKQTNKQTIISKIIPMGDFVRLTENLTTDLLLSTAHSMSMNEYLTNLSAGPYKTCLHPVNLRQLSLQINYIRLVV